MQRGILGALRGGLVGVLTLLLAAGTYPLVYHVWPRNGPCLREPCGVDLGPVVAGADTALAVLVLGGLLVGWLTRSAKPWLFLLPGLAIAAVLLKYAGVSNPFGGTAAAVAAALAPYVLVGALAGGARHRDTPAA